MIKYLRGFLHTLKPLATLEVISTIFIPYGLKRGEGDAFQSFIKIRGSSFVSFNLT